ncbi:MAG TPA: hypothetical protein VJA40_04360 [archaeon]|nr:hypothetical protein [archaeon]
MEKFGVPFKKDVLRFPRLDTVLMIEEAIRKAKGDLTISQVWRALPKKAMWQTYLTALDYLEYSGKIIIESDGHVSWVWNPSGIQRLKSKKLVLD